MNKYGVDIVALVEKTGLPYSTISSRLRYGVRGEGLTAPAAPQGRPARSEMDHVEWRDDLDARRLVDENPDGMTLEEVGDYFDMTREAARQSERTALLKLRCAQRIDELLGAEGGALMLRGLRGKRLAFFESALARAQRMAERRHG